MIQIGNQSRHGRFGACFFSNSWKGNDDTASKVLRIFCARPGSRIWEADLHGNVLRTHKFKSVKVTEASDENYDTHDIENSKNLARIEINEQFVHLQPMDKFFILGHTANSLYIFDLIRSKIVLRSDSFGPLHCIKVIHDECFSTVLVFTKDYKAYTFQMKQLKQHRQIEKNDDYDAELSGVNIEKMEFNSKTFDQTRPKWISQEENVLQELYFICKSSNISKPSSKYRYVHIFDLYDSNGLQQLLMGLELMIRKYNDVTQYKAKKICSQMYLNYIKINSNQDVPHELKCYFIDSFMMVNSSLNDRNTIRCDFCNYPLTIPRFKLKNLFIASIIVKGLINMKESERLFDIICFIPTLFYVLTKFLLNEFTDQFKIERESKFLVDILLPCASLSKLEHTLKTMKFFQSHEFWKYFSNRIVRLQNEKKIQCNRCNTFCRIEISQERILIFTRDMFEICVETLTGLTALRLCIDVADKIPNNGIKKDFFIKCLLNPHDTFQ